MERVNLKTVMYLDMSICNYCMFLTKKALLCNVIQDTCVHLILLLKTFAFTLAQHILFIVSIYLSHLSYVGVKGLSRMLTSRYLSPSEPKPAARL